MKDFYELGQFDLDQIESLLEQSEKYETTPAPRQHEGKVLATLFLNRSLRTLTSFQASMARLGGGSFVVSPEMSIHGLETMDGIVMDGRAAEHIREAVPAIASYADVIGIRALAGCANLEEDLEDRKFNEISALCEIPVINMESAIHHPCQSIADWKTLNDFSVPKKGGKLVVSWVYHPDALPHSVPGDTIHMAALRGMDVTILRPPGFGLPEQLIERARAASETSGGSLIETEDQNSALAGAHIVYARSWMSTAHYGNRLEDRDLRNEFDGWRIDQSWFKHTHDDCKFMHCLPVRRGVEIDDEILDSELSVVTHQARNRMYTQMAILNRLLGAND